MEITRWTLIPDSLLEQEERENESKAWAEQQRASLADDWARQQQQNLTGFFDSLKQRAGQTLQTAGQLNQNLRESVIGYAGAGDVLGKAGEALDWQQQNIQYPALELASRLGNRAEQQASAAAGSMPAIPLSAEQLGQAWQQRGEPFPGYKGAIETFADPLNLLGAGEAKAGAKLAARGAKALASSEKLRAGLAAVEEASRAPVLRRLAPGLGIEDVGAAGKAAEPPRIYLPDARTGEYTPTPLRPPVPPEPAPNIRGPWREPGPDEEMYLDNLGRVLAEPSPLIPPATKGQYAVELFYNNILSGPKTHIVNFIGNALSTALAPVERATAAGIESILAPLQGRRPQRFIGEVKPELLGMYAGIEDGTRRAVAILRHGLSGSLPQYAKPELRREEAIKGPLGAAINLPVRAITAADALFRSMHYGGALYSGAYRMARTENHTGPALASRIAELVHEPPRALIEEAGKLEKYRVFQQDPGEWMKGLLKLRDAEIAGFQPLRFVLPFLQTPTNILKYGLERSPLGMLNPKLWQNLANKSPEASDQLARSFIGSSIAAALATYAANGNITGALPQSPAERDLFYRQGKQPYSIQVGDRWIPYDRFGQISQPLFQVAAVVDAIRDGASDTDDMAMKAAANLARSFTSQTFLDDTADLLDILAGLDSGGKKLERFAGRIASGLVPASAALRTATQLGDRTVRQPQNIVEQIQTGIPGLSQNVPPRLNAFGQEVQRESSPWLPVPVTQQKRDPVDMELARLGVNAGFAGNSIKTVKLTEPEQRVYQQLAGTVSKRLLDKVVSSPQYQQLNDADKSALIKAAVSRARDQAGAAYLNRMDKNELRRRLLEKRAG